MPEAARRRGVGVEAGDGEALGLLGEPGPRQLRGRVAELVDLVVLERLAVGDVVAGDGERRDCGQQVVGVRAHRAVEGHRVLLRDESRLRPNVVRLWPSSRARYPSAMMDRGAPGAVPLRPVLAGRRVLVVGGGHVAQRRVPQLIAAGADVVARVARGDAGRRGAGHGRRDHLARSAASRTPTSTAPGTSSRRPTTPTVNEAVTEGAERRRIFCVRADDATRASAWTPAVGRHAGVTVAVLGNREPRRSAAVRDEILEGLREGTIVARHQRDRSPGVVLVGGGPGRPRADLGGGAQGADGGRRRGGRPAGPARAARRAARGRRADRRRQAARAAAPPSRRRSTGSSSSAPGPGSGWSGSRAATASSSAAASRRSRPAGPPAYRSPWSPG